MATTVKGLIKGLRYISQIFDEKEPEMQIGLPTDVKHVAHIGLDGPAASTPTWMSEFKPPSEGSSGPLAAVGEIKVSSPKPPIRGAKDAVPKSRRHHSTGTGSPMNSPAKKDSDAPPKHSRRHRSAGSSADSASQDGSGSSRRSRRHRSSNQVSESSSQDVPDVPKHSHRRKSKGSSGGGSTRSSRSKGNSLTDIPFTELGSGSDSVHGSQDNPRNLSSVSEVREQ